MRLGRRAVATLRRHEWKLTWITIVVTLEGLYFIWKEVHCGH